MSAPPERLTALKPFSAHSGSFLDTETHRDNVERSTARVVSQACSKQFGALRTRTIHARTVFDVPLERLTALEVFGAHSRAFTDTEMHRDNVERSTARIVS